MIEILAHRWTVLDRPANVDIRHPRWGLRGRPHPAFVGIAWFVFVSLSLWGTSSAADHHVRPGDPPQPILDQAQSGDRIVFLPGLHQHGLHRHRSILYIDKPIEIELRRDAILKLADHETKLQSEAEITIDHGAEKKLNDLSVGGEFDLATGPSLFTVMIDGEGRDGSPDTFKWGVGRVFEYQQQQVPITGDWQSLAHGVQIRFEHRTGHNRGSLWFLSFDGPESYGIRIGYGLQQDYIENVRIRGQGTIDMNRTNNVVPSGLVRNINACVLVHGRVRDVVIEDITMIDTMRSVMLYGEHAGQFLQGGATGPGESFDAEDISIQYTRTLNPNGAGYLLGHPSHRGHLRRVRCNHNYMITGKTALEPNFQLDQYEVIGNFIKSDGHAIHCWRMSTNGLLADNVRFDDLDKRDVVVLGAPSAWQQPRDLRQINNFNHLLHRPVRPPAWTPQRPAE